VNGLFSEDSVPHFNSSHPTAQLTLELLRGRMVSQLMGGLSGSAGISGDIVIPPGYSGVMRQPAAPARSGTEIMNDALSGLRRSEAAMYRQASRNMAEGSSMAGMAAESLKSIQDALQRMQDVAVAIQQSPPPSQLAALEQEYADLGTSVAALVEGTEYNGIKLLDGSNWSQDERIALGTDGATGKISLQAGEASTDLTLFNLDSLKSLPPDPADTATVGILSDFQGWISVIRETYEVRSRLYASEASSFTRQATILDRSVKQTGFDGGKNSGDVLFEIIMSGRGSLVNARG
jgi:flagellin-like hook-associated protein FlgL